MCESSPTDPTSVTLIADSRMRGVWQPQADVLLDVHVVDVDALSYRGRAPQTVLCSAEDEKKHKYLEAYLAHHASFTPLCFSTDGMLGSEANFILRHLAENLTAKWEKSYSEVIGWVCLRICLLYFGLLMV